MSDTDRSDTNNLDGYMNVRSGLGTSIDKGMHTRFVARELLSWQTLDDMYEQDGLAARIVDRLPDDATRETFTLQGSEDYTNTVAELESLGVRQKLADAWRWARLFRGALLIMNVNDGLPMNEPLNLETATKLSSLSVLEARYIIPVHHTAGVGSRGFGLPEAYEIFAPYGAAKTRHIHKSRVIRFDGVKVTDARRFQNGGWGPSVLDRVRQELERLGAVMGYSAGIMHDASVQYLKLVGYRNALSSADTNDKIRQAVAGIKEHESTFRMTVMDADDEIGQVKKDFTGITDVVQDHVLALVRVTDQPRTLLTGEQPTGMNASAESELRIWYDAVSAHQRQTLSPAILRLTQVLQATRKEKPSTPPFVEFAPLWAPSLKEHAETELILAQTDEIRIAAGVQTEDEVREKMRARGEIELEPRDEDEEPGENEREALGEDEETKS